MLHDSTCYMIPLSNWCRTVARTVREIVLRVTNVGRRGSMTTSAPLHECAVQRLFNPAAGLVKVTEAMPGKHDVGIDTGKAAQ